MSKVKEKLNDTALNELMVVIRKNTQPSNCIDNFETLLREIEDPVFVNTAVSSMFNFLTEAFQLFQEIDHVRYKKFKAKMLTNSFLEPQRFFTRTKSQADYTMRLRASVELLEGHYTDITVDTDRNSVRVGVEEAERLINRHTSIGETVNTKEHRSWWYINKYYKRTFNNSVDNCPRRDKFIKDLENVKELARKEMLLWNYIPAIVKAVIQTKRRSLNMDTNSKKFC